jgi:adenylate kinase
MAGKHRFATEEIEKFSTVDLVAELKRRYQVLSRPERSCILLGAPWSGVSTQVSFLRKEWGTCSIKRDDILNSAQTDLHEAVKKLSEEIGSFRCRRGFVLQNFPESEEEAQAFDGMIKEKHANRADYKVIVLGMPHGDEQDTEASITELSKRATGHMIHQQSGRVYNSHVAELSPQTPNVDDVTGESLVCPRFDIAGLAIQARSWWSEKETSLRAFYHYRMQLVDAKKSCDQVSMDISRILLEPKHLEIPISPEKSATQEQ